MAAAIRATTRAATKSGLIAGAYVVPWAWRRSQKLRGYGPDC